MHYHGINFSNSSKRSDKRIFKRSERKNHESKAESKKLCQASTQQAWFSNWKKVFLYLTHKNSLNYYKLFEVVFRSKNSPRTTCNSISFFTLNLKKLKFILSSFALFLACFLHGAALTCGGSSRILTRPRTRAALWRQSRTTPKHHNKKLNQYRIKVKYSSQNKNDKAERQNRDVLLLFQSNSIADIFHKVTDFTFKLF